MTALFCRKHWSWVHKKWYMTAKFQCNPWPKKDLPTNWCRNRAQKMTRSTGKDRWDKTTHTSNTKLHDKNRKTPWRFGHEFTQSVVEISLPVWSLCNIAWSVVRLTKHRPVYRRTLSMTIFSFHLLTFWTDFAQMPLKKIRKSKSESRKSSSLLSTKDKIQKTSCNDGRH